MYALHSLAIVLGIVGTSTVIGGFVGSVPSIIAVIISYIKRGSARGSWAASHYRWQIRTFWFAALWALISILLFISIIGIPFSWLLIVAVGLWVIYRIARGWVALANREPLIFEPL